MSDEEQARFILRREKKDLYDCKATTMFPASYDPQLYALFTTADDLSLILARGTHRWIGTDYLAGFSGVLHLVSPLAGKLPPAEMLDVRMRSGTHLLIPS